MLRAYGRSFTKFVQAIPLVNASSENIAKHFVNEWVTIFGVPEILQSDLGSNLDSSRVIQEMYSILQIDKRRTTPYRPCSNGLAERMNRSIKNILSKFF